MNSPRRAFLSPTHLPLFQRIQELSFELIQGWLDPFKQRFVFVEFENSNFINHGATIYQAGRVRALAW